MKNIGVYEYDEKDILGEGSFGVVYKGRHRQNKQEIVAVKCVNRLNKKSQTAADDKSDREMQILKALQGSPHRNIVSLLYFEKNLVNMTFVMEFCNGGNLEDYMKSKGKLDENTIKTFLKQLAAGLRVAYDKNIIHRDLKPDNILLCFSGQPYPTAAEITLKIADFGVGRFLETGEKAGSTCGTHLYMAPEILLHREDGHDYRVDLWSIGVITYQFLAGSLPKTPLALRRCPIPNGTSPDLTNLLEGLLKDDNNSRFTFEQFLNHRFLENLIQVSVNGPQNVKMMIVKDSSTIDELIDKISMEFALGGDQDSVYLIHSGHTLEYGSRDTLFDADIRRGSTITFAHRLPGGRHRTEDPEGVPDNEDR